MASEATGHTRALTAAIEQLNRDPRPSFIVDPTTYDISRAQDVPVTHCNSALEAIPAVADALNRPYQEIQLDQQAVKFRHWIARASFTDRTIDLYDFRDIIWAIVPVTNTHVLISGLPKHAIDAAVDDVDIVDITSSTITLGEVATSVSPPLHRIGTNDKDCSTSTSYFSENCVEQQPYIDLFHNVDWAKTSAGPIESWCDELRSIAYLVLVDPQPAFLYVGRELHVVHNAAGATFLPDVPSLLMGSTSEKVFPAAFKSFAPVFKTVMTERQPQIIPSAQMTVSRNGRLEERFFNLHFLPIIDRKGQCLGVYESAREVTRETILKRRLSTLLAISTCANGIRAKDIYWARLLEALAANKEDMGFALLYSLQRTSEATTRVLKQDFRPMCTLEGTFGLPANHASASAKIDLASDTFGYAPGLKIAHETNAPVILAADEHPWLQEALQGVTCRGYSAPCQGVVVCPISPNGRTECIAFMVIGLSSCIVLDTEFQQFVKILDRHTAASVASVLLFDEELLRERQRVKDATLVHANLEDRLKLKDQQLLSVEAKFQRLTDRMPVAVCTITSDGNITYANKAFYTTTGHPGDEVSPESWMALVHEDDSAFAMSKFMEAWAVERVDYELKLKKPWTKHVDGEKIATPTWILVSLFLDSDPDTLSKTLVGIMTDISEQKWAESSQYRRTLEALEAKKQQEEFIDTVSHEIRNPLSAILQSVDEIAEYLKLSEASTGLAKAQLQDSLDAIKTITLCCQHQKRVVDDILSLSKIKSQMLEIRPGRTDIPQLLHKATMMFSAELKASNIVIFSTLGAGLESNEYNELMIDSSRVLQILVNLIGNAIKFTRESTKREIRIRCDVHSSRPTPETYDIKYMESSATEISSSHLTDEERKNPIFVHFTVQDTGIGMSNTQKQSLFTRFSQATPRTHIRYGGSGLGLFICKQLCDLQGGATGLKMQNENGTTIAFFVRASKPNTESPTTNSSNGYTATTSNSTLQKKVSILPLPSSFGVSTMNRHENLTLLVVEDNLVNQRVMCKQLQRRGYKVFTANNGVEALEFLKTTTLWKGGHGQIDLSLILLDIEMPVMDGNVCVSRIREMQADGTLLSHIPVIAVSANAREEQINEARAAGMDDNISKPFRIDDVVVKVRALLSID